MVAVNYGGEGDKFVYPYGIGVRVRVYSLEVCQ